VLRSLWFEGRDAPARPPLDRDITADAVVVGGGIVGLTTALLLEREGMEVAVLEMRRVAAGATGYNTAKLSSLHGLTYTQLERTLGREKARLYGEANEAGIARVFELAEQLGIDCDLRRKPNYTYTESAADLDQVREEARVAGELGLPASYVEALDLPFPVAGAVRFEDQAEFHPVRYLEGIAAALEGPLHEGTMATGVQGGRVRTAVGETLTAEHVVLATHLSFLDRGLYFARCHPERSYVVAGRSSEAPEGMYLSTEQPAHSIRAHGEWLLVGGESHKAGQADAAERYARLESWASERFGI
jgi:glycine/D-amino acid oxidase-like deaminating enzyme